MKLLALILVLMVVGALALMMQLPQSYLQNVRIEFLDEASASRAVVPLRAFARTHDWPALLTAHGLELPAEPQAQLLAPLRDGDLQVTGAQVRLPLRCAVAGTLAAEQVLAHAGQAADLIKHRLQVEAWRLEYEHAPAEARRHLAWQLMAAGFPTVFRQFLQSNLETEPDPALRELLQTMAQRPAAHTR